MTTAQSQEEGWWGTACKTGIAYARMSATLIISVLMRLMLDAIGFVCLGQTKPSEFGFWFAKCHGRDIVSCLSMALYLYLVSMLVAALVMYFIAPGVNNPMRNPFARRYSLAVLLDAVSWFPISVAIGKINLFQEAFENVAEAHRRRECVVALKHIIINLEFVVIVTGVTAILAHISLKYVKDVARAHASGERSFRAFLKVFVQVAVSTIPWLVGWSCWKLVLSILDLFECDWFSKDNAATKTWPSQAISFPVLMLFNLFSVGFYIRFGPEPVIPNPETQQAVYRNPYVGSVKRTLMSLAIYIAMVFVLMTIVDVEYGILYKFLYMVSRDLNPREVNPFEQVAQVRLRILCKYFVWFCTVTVLSIVISLVITIMTSVDMSTSAKLSRRMISCQFQRELPAWPPQRSPARYHKAVSKGSLAEGLSQELQEGLMPEGSDTDDELSDGHIGDEVAGPDPIALLDGSDIVVPSPPPAVSAGICASVMAFDVLGFTVCTIWAAFAKALYAFILGMYADIHPAVYLTTMAFYCFFLAWGLLRFVFIVFPSKEELAVPDREELGEAACCTWWNPLSAWFRELISPAPAKRLTWSGSECESDSSVFLELRDQHRHSLSS